MSDAPILTPSGRFNLRFLVAAWALVLVLWGTNALRAGGSVVFLLAAAAALVYLTHLVRSLARTESTWRALPKAVALVLLVAVPVAFDPTTSDVFNLTKFTLVVSGAVVLGGLLVVDYIRHGRALFWRNGLHWPVLALLGWTAITTVLSTNVRMSVLGFYKSYDGLLAHLALAFLFFALVHILTINHIKTVLSVVYFGGGGLVILYGLLQLHDRTFEGSPWDWIDWGPAGFRDSAIWSGLGNPNHLAGFLAVLLPIGLALLLVHRDWRVRLLTTGLSVWLVLEVIQTTTRGAWLAVLISVPVLLALMAPELKARSATLLPIVGLVVAGVVVSGIVLGASRNIPEIFGSIFDFGRFSTATQRVELWESAVNMAGDRPVFGFGPDTYRIPFQQYQTETYVRTFGLEQIANGPHNVFMNYLSTEGVPGLLLFGAVLTFAALRAVGGWRRLCALEENAPVTRRGHARDARLLLAGASAGGVAYLVQASFNVQQIGLSFLFWVLLAIVCVVALDTGVPVSLRPLEILAGAYTAPAGKPATNRARSANKRRGPRSTDGLPVAPARLEVEPADGRAAIAGRLGRRAAIAGIVVAVAGLLWPLTGPYRADHDLLAARKNVNAAELKGVPELARLESLNEARTILRSAMAANPWEALYAGEAARVAAMIGELKDENASLSPGTDEPLVEGLDDARVLYRRAVSLEPDNSRILSAYAQVLLRLSEESGEDAAAWEQAIASLRRAVEVNPWDPSLVRTLASILASQGELDEARAVIEGAPDYVREDDEVQALAAELSGADSPTDVTIESSQSSESPSP